MTQHAWHYVKKGILGDETLGPFDEASFVAMVERGELKPATLVSGTRTGGRWVELTSVPGLAKTLEAGESHRRQVAAAEAEQRERQRQAQKDERERQLAEQRQIDERMRVEAEEQRREDESRRKAKEAAQQRDPAWQLQTQNAMLEKNNELLKEMSRKLSTLTTNVTIGVALLLLALFALCAGGLRLFSP